MVPRFAEVFEITKYTERTKQTKKFPSLRFLCDVSAPLR